MIFLDANIIIYAHKPSTGYLMEMIDATDEDFACSDIVRLEVLGFHGLEAIEKRVINTILSNAKIYPITSEIMDTAITLRQQKSIKSPDAIIAATALMHKAELWTNNTRDFKDIKNLRLHNPIKEKR